ncbi:MAG: DNA polymerase I [Synergistaceae bacterium]|nr:DNA polymerase I [Synergistaceae bacterium]
MKPKTLLLVDGHGLAYRGFYALPELTAPDGRPTSAIVGFFNMFLKIVDEREPDAVAVIFDAAAPTFRHEAFEDYKGTRKPTPELLKEQIPLIKEILEAAGYPPHEKAGLEADDIIAATALAAAEKGIEVLILTADKDLLQIVGPSIRVLRPQKGVSTFRLYDPEVFVNEYGFAPNLMADYLALVGDSSDNVPGVPGIGDKTARRLLASWGGLEEILAHLDDLPKGQANRLREGANSARASLELTRLRLEGALPLESLSRRSTDSDSLNQYCTELGLEKLRNRFGANGVYEDRTLTVDLAQTREVSLAALAEGALLIVAEDGDDVLFGDGLGLFARVSGTSLPAERCVSLLRSASKVITWGYKELCRKLPEGVLPPERVWDGKIVDYLLHPDRGERSLEKVLQRPSLSPGDRILLLKETYDAWMPLLGEGQRRLMERVDLPLSPVLAAMEEEGLGLDRLQLGGLEAELKDRLALIEKKIGDRAHRRINLNSPKQVGELLFDHLGLPPLKRTKTGYSTDISVLEELASLPDGRGEVPALIVEHREVAKMLSGFISPLLATGEGDRSILHSTFEQTTTGTGRLSSRDPNLQNLPVFGHWAARLRQCLVPRQKGALFVAADYSQIELRVLAHYSNDPRLRAAFAEGRDIHAETASSLFGVAAEKVSAEQRRRAKVVNFGLLYGMTAFGLAQRLSIGQAEAKEIIDRYFATFPLVADFLEGSVVEAKKRGYTQTLFGRRRPLDEVSTVEGRGNGALRRVAVNTPIQGTAADIAKMAMIGFHERTRREGKTWPLVLQVHDSLVCACLPQEADEAEKTLVTVMEGAFPLSVPLVASPKRGDSLADI